MAKTDLNLMVIFDAIMQEQSITAASEQLAMTQPSVSNAVSRMRHQWNDPLFVKQGRGIRPTPYAEELWQRIRSPLNDIRQAENPQAFNIRNSQRCFRIALTDWMLDIFWLPLRKRIEQQAPDIDLRAIPYTAPGKSVLVNADVDLILDYYNDPHPHIQSEWLFDNHFVCAMRADHPLVTHTSQHTLSLEQFIQADRKSVV